MEKFSKIEGLFSGAKTRKYRAGEIITHTGDQPQYVYYIESGFVRIYLINNDGQELTLYMMGPKLFFSMGWAIANMPTNYNFEAFTPTTVSYILNKTFYDFVANEHELLMELMKVHLFALDGIIVRMEALTSGNALNKISTAILFAIQYFNITINDKNVIINLPLTHRIIASFAGLTRESASIAMKKLKKEKIISYKRHLLIINDLEALKQKSMPV